MPHGVSGQGPQKAGVKALRTLVPIVFMDTIKHEPGTAAPERNQASPKDTVLVNGVVGNTEYRY